MVAPRNPSGQPERTAVMPSLTRRAAHGVKWTTTSMVVSSFLLFVQATVLARLLTKADFGLMAMVLVVVTFGQAYADMGMSSAVIWRQETSRDTLSSLYWLNLITGAVVFIVLLALTPMIAHFFKQPQLGVYLPWAAVIFLIVPFGQLFQVLLEKQLRFRVLATNELIATTLGVAVTITCALAGLGVFALIVGQLTGAASRTAVLAVVGWRRWHLRPHLRFSDLGGYVGFGLNQMGERTVTLVTDNLDYLMIGRFLGSAVLGVYAVAYQLAVIPYRRINPVVMRVAFPAFSMRRTDDTAFRKGYFRVSVTVVFIVFPWLIGLLVVAPVAVPVLFGSKWLGAVPIVQVLALLGMLSALDNPTGSLLLAKGRADLGFRMNALRLLVTALVFVVVVRYGALAIAWAWVGIEALSFVLWQSVTMHLMHSNLFSYLRAIARPLLLSALMGVCLEAMYLVLRSSMDSGVILLLLVVLAGGALHLGIWLLFNRAFVFDTYATFKSARAETV